MTSAINIKPGSADLANLPVLEISNLAVAYRSHEGFQRVVHEVSLLVRPGEVVALVGENGIGRAAMPPRAGIERGRLASFSSRKSGRCAAGALWRRVEKRQPAGGRGGEGAAVHAATLRNSMAQTHGFAVHP